MIRSRRPNPTGSGPLVGLSEPGPAPSGRPSPARRRRASESPHDRSADIGRQAAPGSAGRTPPEGGPGSRPGNRRQPASPTRPFRRASRAGRGGPWRRPSRPPTHEEEARAARDEPGEPTPCPPDGMSPAQPTTSRRASSRLGWWNRSRQPTRGRGRPGGIEDEGGLLATRAGSPTLERAATRAVERRPRAAASSAWRHGSGAAALIGPVRTDPSSASRYCRRGRRRGSS